MYIYIFGVCFIVWQCLYCIIGPPSAPTISSNGNSIFGLLSVIISPPVTSAVCVEDYVLTITESGDLSMCDDTTYSFTAHATTKDVAGDVSDPFTGCVGDTGKAGNIASLTCSWLNVYIYTATYLCK